MEKLKLEYLTPESARAYDYTIIPTLLILHEAFRGLDGNAKLLYGLILNRSSLSVRNHNDFADDHGRIFVIYTIDQVMADMACSNKYAVKMMKQLEDIGLIEKKRHGQGKPSTIFVKDFSSVQFLKCPSDTSRSVRRTLQEVSVGNFSIRNSKLDNSYLESIYLSGSDIEAAETHDGLMDRIDEEKKKIEEMVRDNVDYETLKHNGDVDVLDGIVELIVETLSSNALTARIGKEDKPAAIVKNQLLKLELKHIEYALWCLRENATKIKNPKAYLLTTLYNAPMTVDAYYQNRINCDSNNGRLNPPAFSPRALGRRTS